MSDRLVEFFGSPVRRQQPMRFWTASPSRTFACCLVAATAVVGGCTGGDGETPTNDPVVSVFEPVNPTGTVTGQVVNALDGQPVANATVTLPAMDATATTAANGGFVFEDVPSSAQIALSISADGLSSAIDTVTIPSSAGTLAQDNGVAFSGPVGLLPTVAGEGGARARFVIRQDGVAVSDSVVDSRLDVGYFVSGAAFGQLIGTAVVDGDGWVIDGLPDLRALAVALPSARVRVAMSPADPSLFRPTVIDLDVGALLSRGTVVVDLEPTVEPPPPEPDPEPGFAEGDALEVVDSTLVDLVDNGALLPSVLTLANGVTLTFNRPILAGTFFVDAIASDGAAVPATATTSDDLTFAISFGAGQAGGSEIRVVIDAIADAPAAEGIAPYRAEGTFFVADPAPVSIASAYYAENGNREEVACPDQLNNRQLVIELTGPVGARVLQNGGATAAGLNDLIRVGIFSDGAGGVDLFNVPTGDPVLASIVETTGSGSGFRTRLVVPGNAFVNPPNPQGNNADNAALVLRFNDLTTADELGGGGDVVVRRPNGQPLTEVTATIDIARSGCAN